MKLVVDLHTHSHYSRATSRDLTLETSCRVGQQKGIGLLSTGDFTHPKWFAELQEKLVPIKQEEGCYQLQPNIVRSIQDQVPASCQAPMRFVLGVEISCIYSQDGAVKKAHNLVFVPHFAAAQKLNQRLSKIGNLAADGRPILGLSSRDLLEIVLESDPLSYLIPAHIWTPHFSIFGSRSGFDRLEDCFGDLSSHIFALETGLSSDPAMNYRISALDKYSLMSSSDAHSPAKLAREATVVNIEPSFVSLRKAFEEANPEELLGTIEFFPEEGKYHLDGHRNCEVRLTPKERAAYKGRCPVCGKKLTVGVLSRIEDLADRPENTKFLPPRARPFVNLVPLIEIVGEVLQVGSSSKKALALHAKIISALGNELFVLQEAPKEDLRRVAGSLFEEAVLRVRQGKVHIEPGYDGEYGKVQIFAPNERISSKQISLLSEV